MKKIILIDVLDDPPWNITKIYQSVLESVGINGNVIVGVDGLSDSINISSHIEMIGIIIPGSIHHIMEKKGKEWKQALCRFIRKYYNRIPILGVCFGHQAIAHALGGKIVANKQGREMGTVPIYITKEACNDELFSTFADGSIVQETHLDHVTILPDGSICLAYNQHSPIQAFRIGESWGIQFHPELKPKLFKQLFGRRIKNLTAEGKLNEAENLKKIIANIEESPASIEILKKFIRYCFKEV